MEEKKILISHHTLTYTTHIYTIYATTFYLVNSKKH